MDKRLLCVIGATASGKTTLAVHIAHRTNGEIISADSRQVYQKMNIGTGKDLSEYKIDKKKIPHHLIDIHQPGYKYNVFEFQRDFFKAFKNIAERQKLPILCGGTGMYVESVLKTYKLIQVPVNKELRKSLSGKSLEELEAILMQYKKLHNRTDIDTVKRAIRAIEIEEYYRTNTHTKIDFPIFKYLIIGIKFDRENRRKHITHRLYKRLKMGMVDEVKELLSNGVKTKDLMYYGLEYRFITEYLLGKSTYDDMVRQLNTAIHQYAKRQMTWFRRMERNGLKVYWIDGNIPMEEKMNNVMMLLNKL